MRKARMLGLLVVALTAPAGATGTPGRASGTLEVNARLMKTRSSGNAFCPSGTPAKAQCFRYVGEGSIRGLARSPRPIRRSSGRGTSSARFSSSARRSWRLRARAPSSCQGPHRPAGGSPCRSRSDRSSSRSPEARERTRERRAPRRSGRRCSYEARESAAHRSTPGPERLLCGGSSSVSRRPPSAGRCRRPCGLPGGRSGCESNTRSPQRTRSTAIWRWPAHRPQGRFFGLGRTKVACSATDFSANESKADSRSPSSDPASDEPVSPALSTANEFLDTHDKEGR
jgi:hypothetical protein